MREGQKHAAGQPHGCDGNRSDRRTGSQVIRTPEWGGAGIWGFAHGGSVLRFIRLGRANEEGGSTLVVADQSDGAKRAPLGAAGLGDHPRDTYVAGHVPSLVARECMTQNHPSVTAVPPQVPRATAIAELRGIRKTYFKPDGGIMVEALRTIDLTFMPGEYVAIMGSSGSGKSTLMNVLGCLDRPTAGQFLLGGRDVTGMNDEELSTFRGRTIGFIFQSFNLIPELTIVDNVATPLFYQRANKHERTERAKAALAMVGLGDRLDHRPKELSGGQQQRVAIARALVTKPLVLMADEPTGNLDSKTGTSILDLFEKLNEESGMTILMVTHDDNVADRCKRVVRLKDGLLEYDRAVSARHTQGEAQRN